MKYKEEYLFSYINRLNTLKECDSIIEWIKTLHASPLQLEERLRLVEDKRKIITRRLRVKEFIDTKGYTNQERLCEFPYLVDLLSKCYYAGYSTGENEVYRSMNLRPPNDTFYDDFNGYMNTAWDVKDELLKQLYKEEINKL